MDYKSFFSFVLLNSSPCLLSEKEEVTLRHLAASSSIFILTLQTSTKWTCQFMILPLFSVSFKTVFDTTKFFKLYWFLSKVASVIARFHCNTTYAHCMSCTSVTQTWAVGSRRGGQGQKRGQSKAAQQSLDTIQDPRLPEWPKWWKGYGDYIYNSSSFGSLSQECEYSKKFGKLAILVAMWSIFLYLHLPTQLQEGL